MQKIAKIFILLEIIFLGGLNYPVCTLDPETSSLYDHPPTVTLKLDTLTLAVNDTLHLHENGMKPVNIKHL